MGWKIKKNNLNQYLFLLMKLQNLEEFNNILVHPASGALTLSKGRPPIARLYNYGHTIFCFEKTLHCDNFIPCQRPRKIWNITLPETSKDMKYSLARDLERYEIFPCQRPRKIWNISLPETSKDMIYYLARDLERYEILPCQRARKMWNITLPEGSKDMKYYLARGLERYEIFPCQRPRKIWNITLPESSKDMKYYLARDLER